MRETTVINLVKDKKKDHFLFLIKSDARNINDTIKFVVSKLKEELNGEVKSSLDVLTQEERG